jgi:hypothetical protein
LEVTSSVFVTFLAPPKEKPHLVLAAAAAFVFPSDSEVDGNPSQPMPVFSQHHACVLPSDSHVLLSSQLGDGANDVRASPCGVVEGSW